MNTVFGEFELAVDVANPGETIILNDNVELTGKITIDKAITIDGNGKTRISSDFAIGDAIKIFNQRNENVFKERFERKSYTITFVNGDRVIDDSTVKKVFNYGEKITVPEEFYYFNNTEVSDLPEGEDPLEWTWR